MDLNSVDQSSVRPGGAAQHRRGRRQREAGKLAVDRLGNRQPLRICRQHLSDQPQSRRDRRGTVLSRFRRAARAARSSGHAGPQRHDSGSSGAGRRSRCAQRHGLFRRLRRDRDAGGTRAGTPPGRRPGGDRYRDFRAELHREHRGEEPARHLGRPSPLRGSAGRGGARGSERRRAALCKSRPGRPRHPDRLPHQQRKRGQPYLRRLHRLLRPGTEHQGDLLLSRTRSRTRNGSSLPAPRRNVPASRSWCSRSAHPMPLGRLRSPIPARWLAAPKCSMP